MANPLTSLNKPLLNLTSMLTHPLGEELSIALMTFVSTFLIIWLLSKLLNFKKQDYKTSFFISTIVTATSFIIRSISLIFSLTDAQKPVVNRIAIVIEIFLLLVLIKKSYGLKWPKSILTLVITYFARLMVMGMIALIVLFFFTTIPQDIEEKRLGDKIKIGGFETTF